MLWCALHFPTLALDLLRQADIDPNLPLAVIEGPEQRPWIHQCNRAARRSGVQPGQSLSAARVLCPALSLQQRNRANEAQALQHLAGACYAWSDRVCLDLPLPGARASRSAARPAPLPEVLLEIAASERLFGPAQDLVRIICQSIQQLGYTLRSGCAPTPRAALLLARVRNSRPVFDMSALKQALAAIPIEVSDLDAPTQALLHGSGLHRIGALLSLPRPELTRRIGQHGMAWLDALLGRRAEAPPAWSPPARFEQYLELPAEVHYTQGLQFPLKRLLQQLDAFLIGQDAGVQRILIHIDHARLPRHSIEMGLLRAQRGVDQLFGLCRDRLERQQLAAPVRSLGIEAGEVLRFSTRAGDLFERSDTPGDGLDGLLERLRARLGDDAVYGLGSHDDHRPERSWKPLPLPAREGTQARSHRPLWLLPQPQPMDSSQLQLLSGPERIESGWWDGDDCRRDYYLACDRRGAWCWVFRQAQAGWFVHGFFG